MWGVERPDFDVEETYKTCISKVRVNELKTRLTDITADIVAASDDYAARAETEELHLVPQSDDVAGKVSRDEMVAVYNGRMAGKKGPGRSIYTAIKLLPAHDRCPLCDHRDVTTLDHVLPKTLFPALAVTPVNLVGSCKDCNKAKLASAPTCAADAALHPYFDDLSNHTWLQARVVEQDVCAVLFHVAPQNQWSDNLNCRLEKQFRTLGLGRLYTQQAAREMSGIRVNLIRVFDSGNPGAEAVRRELHHQWQSRRADRRNSWQTAMYKSLSRNDWFCEEGFRLGDP